MVDGALADARMNLRFGWASLLVFVVLGGVLESMHALKTGWYLDVPNTTRRMMWTLAHAHGTLLALVNVVFALTVRGASLRRRRLSSRCLVGAGLLMPSGFFLGGIDARGGDPGLGVLLVPVGALLLAVGVALTAVDVGAAWRSPGSGTSS